MTGAVAKVHLIFSSKHLMERDANDFKCYWLLLGYDKSKLECHVGLDNWKPNQGELLVVDEIDHIIFKDPAAFSEFIENCILLGFTATPDDFRPAGAECAILGLLQCKKFDYIIQDGDLSLKAEQVAELFFDEIPACSSIADKASSINKYALSGPVLVYCHETLTAALREAGCDPFIITEDTDAQLLRSLDRVTQEGRYRVVVAQDPFAMRGYDYRSSRCTMTLVIDRSFDNVREAI